MVDIEDKTIELGRFISEDEVKRSALVVVLGGDIKEKFFPNQDPIGKTLKVKRSADASCGRRREARLILRRLV